MSIRLFVSVCSGRGMSVFLVSRNCNCEILNSSAIRSSSKLLSSSLPTLSLIEVKTLPFKEKCFTRCCHGMVVPKFPVESTASLISLMIGPKGMEHSLPDRLGVPVRNSISLSNKYISLTARYFSIFPRKHNKTVKELAGLSYRCKAAEFLS